MPQYTDRYNIPYPTTSDPIHLGAQQMADLAQKTDEVMGAVSDASALDATTEATPGRIVQRDAAGRAEVADGTSPGHIATRRQVNAVSTEVSNVSTDVSNVTSRLGGLSFQQRTTPPPAGTPSTMITFVPL